MEPGVVATEMASGSFSNSRPNFSTEGPIILSDTLGVDFGPYLSRIIFIVRRNWYSVIPESARLGEKGRVGIVFEILKDGSVPQLRLVASSGPIRSTARPWQAFASRSPSHPCRRNSPANIWCFNFSSFTTLRRGSRGATK